MILNQVANAETENQEVRTVKIQKNIVPVRSCSKLKLNDVAVNDKTLGVIVKPCKIYKHNQWKQISRKKCPQTADSIMNCNFPQELLDLDRRDKEREIDTVKNGNRTEKDLLIVENKSDDKLEVYKLDEVGNNHISWLNNIQDLNQTYLIRDSEDIEQLKIFKSMWEPVKDSPRVGFYFKDTKETEVCEADKKKLERNTKEHEEIRVQELKMSNEDEEYNSNISRNHEAQVSGHRTEEIRPGSEDEKHIQKTENTDPADWEELCVNEKHVEDKQITIDEDITKAEEILEEIKNPPSNISQNLSNSYEHKLSSPDAMYLATQETSVEHEESLREFKIDSTDNNNLSLNNRPFYSKCEDLILHSDDRSDLIFSNSFINQNQNHKMCPEDDVSRCKSNIYRSQMKECFNTSNFESEETDYNFDLNKDTNMRTENFACPINKREGSRKMHQHVGSNVDYRGSNTTTEDNTRGDNDLESSITLKDNIVEELQYCHEKVVSNMNVNLSRHIPSSTRRSVKEHSRHPVEMTHKIKGNMDVLRDSTDSLISSVEFVEFASIEQLTANRVHEREIIKINRPSKRSRMREILPDISGESMGTRENGERSLNQTYWERASKISQSRLNSLDSSFHVEYKLAKRNPRARILPPVPSYPLTQPR